MNELDYGIWCMDAEDAIANVEKRWREESKRPTCHERETGSSLIAMKTSGKKSTTVKIYNSSETMSRVFNQVRRELWRLGILWDGSLLESVECTPSLVECVARGAEGLWKKKRNAIAFPRIFLAFGKKDTVVDVFRHEFGHALADLYPDALKKGGVFRAAFGGSYGDKPAKGTDPADWEDRCVSDYAATKTQEDFAETFMLFVKHRGKIPAKFAKRPAIRKKWNAVAAIVKAVAASAR